MLASFENPASISPYRVNTSYRRPAGGDSDHGYSTMTPHEDSEHASLPCLDPHSIAKDRFKPTPYSSMLSHPPVLPPPPSSSSRRSRSPTPPHTRLSTYTPIPEQTCLTSDVGSPIPGATSLKGPHSVIANVQVHMVDSHWVGLGQWVRAARQVPFSVCVFKFRFPLRFGCVALSRMFHGALAGTCELEGLGYFCTEVQCIFSTQRFVQRGPLHLGNSKHDKHEGSSREWQGVHWRTRDGVSVVCLSSFCRLTTSWSRLVFTLNGTEVFQREWNPSVLTGHWFEGLVWLIKLRVVTGHNSQPHRSASGWATWIVSDSHRRPASDWLKSTLS